MEDRSKRMLILGAHGLLGKDLTLFLKRDFDLIFWDIEELDITDRETTIDALNELSPDEVVNCAAYADVDGCETNKELAMRINGYGPGYIAEACYRIGARLTHISTDYVFDGMEEREYWEQEKPNPINSYGRSKLMGENRIISSGCYYLIIRTQWLYGQHGKNFVDTITTLAGSGDAIRVVDDQYGKPTWSYDLALGMSHLLSTDAYGLYHIASNGSCTWYDLAEEIIKTLKNSCDIIPVKTEKYPRPARRPAHAVLNCDKIREAFGIALPHWRNSLRSYLQTKS